MKIAIASDDKESISDHFGRALGFVVFELVDGKVVDQKYRENKGKNTGECGSCNHAVMIENIKDCEIVISYGMGQRIYQDLKDAGISAVVTDEKNVKDAVEKFLKDKLNNRLDKLH